MHWRSTTYLQLISLLAKKMALPYSPAIQYALYQTCLWRGALYYCIEPAGTTGTYNPAHWQPLQQYNPDATYNTGQMTIAPPADAAALATLAKATATTTGTYNPAHWQAIQLHHAAAQWADVWNSQTEYIGLTEDNTELPFPMPALLIEFHNTVWQNLGGNTGIQTGACTINIHLLQEVYADSYHNSANQPLALSNLNFLDAVHTALQNNGGTYFSPLNRTEETLDTNHPNYSHHILTYTTTIHDPAKAEENALLTTLHQNAELHINPRYKQGVGGSYTMLAKAEQTITQNQPPPPQGKRIYRKLI